MPIRPYQAKDAAELPEIFRRAVRAIAPKDYSPAQVEAWASRAPSAERIHALYSDGRTALVATDDGDRPVAFVDLEADGHINMLYCAPEAAGTGIASALYDRIEQELRRRRVIRAYVEASEAARRFFQKRGFAVVAKRELSIGEVPIHNYAMEKALLAPNLPNDVSGRPVRD
jgi:putative acetyltransferase